MLHLRVTGLRASSADGMFTFSLRDEYGRWGPYQATEPELGIVAPIEMNDRPAIRKAITAIEKAKEKGEPRILRETGGAGVMSRIELLDWERQEAWERSAHN